jgi:hypothetical protein
LIYLKFIKKIYLCILNAEDSTTLEIFNLEIGFKNIIDYEYQEIRLYFKSLLSNLWHKLILKNIHTGNTTFTLCIETVESKVVTSKKVYSGVLSLFENSFVKDMFSNDLLNVFKGTEVCVSDEDILNITISRNFI